MKKLITVFLFSIASLLGYSQFTSWHMSYPTVEELPSIELNSITAGLAYCFATADATVSSQGSSSVTERGIVYGFFDNPTINDNKIVNGSGVGNFITDISGLYNHTRYRFRAYAINSVGISYSNQIELLTYYDIYAEAYAIEVTNTTTQIGLSMLLNYNTIYKKSLLYKKVTDSNYTRIDRVNENFNETWDLIGLSENTSYDWKTYTYLYGDCSVYTTPVDTFTTISSSIPIVSTSNITEPYNISSYYAVKTTVFGGNVTSQGGSNVTENGIIYSSTNSNPTIGGSDVSKYTISSGIGAFSANNNNVFTPGVMYYVRAYAINSYGTGYGDVITFTRCSRPTGLSSSVLEYVINIDGSLTYFFTSNSLASQACYDWNNPNGRSISISGHNFQYSSLTVNSQIYIENNNTDCSTFADGYYLFLDVQDKIIGIQNGIIISVTNCP